MCDAFDTVIDHEALDQGRIADIAFDDRDVGITRELGDVRALEGRVVEIVEIIQYDELVATLTQCQG
jgi:hypothetical protein